MEDVNYKYTEEDVEVALRFLRLHYQKFATPENAIKVLKFSKKKFSKVDELSSDVIEKLLIDLEEY